MLRKLLVLLLVINFTAVGCTGSFNLTKKVYNFHRSQSDKWSDEIFFLVVAILPVYGLATFADAIIFNSIEFWTGENPVASNSTEKTERYVKQGNLDATLSFNKDQMTIESKEIGSPLILERNGSVVVAKDQNGNVLFTSVAKSNGDVSVYDKDVHLVKNISASDIALAKEKYTK